MWPFKTKSADHALKELVDGLSAALGEKLVSVLIFGSKASGEYREGCSNINVFILLDSISAEILQRMAAPIRPWIKAGHPMPVFLPQAELKAYADNLPIEFLDMQDHHKVLFGGEDPLQTLAVDRRHLRTQCIQELSTKLLKLRQGLVLLGENPKRLRYFLLDSLPSILTLFRAALRLEADVPKGYKIVAAKELAMRAGFDADVLERLWDLHMRRQTDNLADLAWQYLEGIERVLAYVNKHIIWRPI
jgi:hypothetical protein